MATTGTIEIPPTEFGTILMRLHGESELIQHAWSEKAKRMMRDKQQKKATGPKEAKDPEAEYKAAMYTFEDGSPGHPSVAFKAAAVAAARQLDGLTMTFLRGVFHIPGELVTIEGQPRMREDMVRLNGQTADLRYRPGFPEWKAIVPVKYNKRAITMEQIVHLFNTAGFSVGVGEWRPDKNGPYGRFSVESVAVVD